MTLFINHGLHAEKIYPNSIGINGVLWINNVNYNYNLWLFLPPTYLKIDYIVQ